LLAVGHAKDIAAVQIARPSPAIACLAPAMLCSPKKVDYAFGLSNASERFIEAKQDIWDGVIQLAYELRRYDRQRTDPGTSKADTRW
jgi:hypothetical protein